VSLVFLPLDMTVEVDTRTLSCLPGLKSVPDGSSLLAVLLTLPSQGGLIV